MIQFTVKHEQNIDCGGDHIKLSDCKLNQDKLDNSEYNKDNAKDIGNTDKPRVIQFTAKQEQNIDRSGDYIKLFDCKLDQATMYQDSPYNVMLGPNINLTNVATLPRTSNVYMRDNARVYTRDDKRAHMRDDVRVTIKTWGDPGGKLLKPCTQCCHQGLIFGLSPNYATQCKQQGPNYA